LLAPALNAVFNNSKESAIQQLRRPLIRLLNACISGVCTMAQAWKPGDDDSNKKCRHGESDGQGAIALCNCAFAISLLRSTVAVMLKGDKLARADNAVWLLEMLGTAKHLNLTFAKTKTCCFCLTLFK
jgi:hypothetical protein